MAYLNLKDIFKKIKTHNENTNQILTIVMQSVIISE